MPSEVENISDEDWPAFRAFLEARLSNALGQAWAGHLDEWAESLVEGDEGGYIGFPPDLQRIADASRAK